jgi:hypothetical protein
MAKGMRSVPVAAAIAALALTGETTRAGERATLTVVLHVNNLAGTAGADLDRAYAEAGRIFGDIGVRLLWLDISEGPNAGTCEGLGLSVSLLPPHLVREAVSQRGGDGVLGAAVRSAGFALIYSERISALAPRKLIAEGLLLGRVIAHEIGHLLLRTPYHSSTGLMTAGMETDPTGLRARFTLQESRAIRALLESKAGKPEERTNCGN